MLDFLRRLVNPKTIRIGDRVRHKGTFRSAEVLGRATINGARVLTVLYDSDRQVAPNVPEEDFVKIETR